LERDAISAGVSKIGGLFTTADIRTLICYIMSSIEEPMSGNMLCEVLHSEGIANIFEVSDSLAFLENSGHIKEFDESGDYVVTDAGRNVAETLGSHLSSVVKERAYRAVLKSMVIIRNTKETSYKIYEEDGRTFIDCTALDQNKPFMSVKLLLTDEDQALFVKQKFLEHASEIYSKIFEIILK
jgi:hypothetical protein